MSESSDQLQHQRQAAARYFAPVIGAVITSVEFDGNAYWFHLSDGSVIEVAAERGSGFEITLHP